MNTLRGRKGFTLVEIMIVVAIIGLLAAIAIPNLLRARVNSNDSAVQGDSRTFSTANESFRAAQMPPAYAAAIGNLTAGATPYLDTTWSAAGAIKHGHTITYNVAGAPAATYSLVTTPIAGQAVKTFCIDHTGVLRSNTSAGGVLGPAPTGNAAGCAGGTPVT